MLSKVGHMSAVIVNDYPVTEVIFLTQWKSVVEKLDTRIRANVVLTVEMQLNKPPVKREVLPIIGISERRGLSERF